MINQVDRLKAYKHRNKTKDYPHFLISKYHISRYSLEMEVHNSLEYPNDINATKAQRIRNWTIFKLKKMINQVEYNMKSNIEVNWSSK